MYCHEGGGPRGGRDVDARIWLIQADGSNNRCAGYHETEPGAGSGELITHEAFMPDGKHFYYLRLPQEPGKRSTCACAPWRIVTLVKICRFRLAPRRAIPRQPLPGRRRQGRTRPGHALASRPGQRRETPLCVHGSSYRVRGQATAHRQRHPGRPPASELLPDGQKCSSPATNTARTATAPCTWPKPGRTDHEYSLLHTHDLGRYIQPYGFGPRTPNLQRPAGEGALFRNAFCLAPACFPSPGCFADRALPAPGRHVRLDRSGMEAESSGATPRLPAPRRGHGERADRGSGVALR